MDTGSEFELIRRLTEHLAAPRGRLVVGPGDDAAVTEPDGAAVTSVDAIVEGVHFRREAGMVAIGHKALAQALSDLAAMGAAAGEAYVALGSPPDLSPEQCLEIYTGLGELAESTGTVLAGGDVVRSPVLWLSVTVVGRLPSAAAAVLRSGARPGDVVAVTGTLGGAAAALAALEAGEEAPADLRLRLDAPHPRLAEGIALREAGASAMIDISDGLGGDALHIARASGVGLRIELDLLPLAPGVGDAELAAAGGEDYELLVCLPPESFDSVAGVGAGLTRIGVVTGGAEVELLRPDGSRVEPRGFDQFRDAR